ncbi:SPOR domain-containing protein [Colwellia echini]|uniref:SPOR domain-containing protein n=1 Tax=Colwellia echini TaxID=1982103 RepID=A0ABY3MVW0_9GAMM|nr:SPOR domain-containing protein [Colwellia echini]TYK65244.1 hypothetical protein CWS31_011325 [Colwellia echini]
MSALANILSSHRSSKNLSEDERMTTAKQNSANSISDISVTTRIDYNLRFAKQAVLVVGDNAAQYSQIASQYLVSLSNGSSSSDANSAANNSQINVAFVSASTKLNDIQIRCRLIEQLFVNTLFDPEQSLAVSVLKFAKQHGEAITIVIDHAHALSLQIKYELCQLVDQAKKHNLLVNVVIFGLMEAAQQLSINKGLFKNKIAVIDAESGQIISFTDNKIKPKKTKISLTLFQKLSLGTVIFVLIGLIFLGFKLVTAELNKQSNVLAKKNTASMVIKPESSISYNGTQEIINAAITQTELNTALEPSINTQASSAEINSAILVTEEINNIEPVLAETADVMSALNLAASNNNSAEAPGSSFTESNAVIGDLGITNKSSEKLTTIDGHYYKNQMVVYDQGYVIQIAGFSDKQLWQRFINDNRENNLHSYKRLLNEKNFIVVTSQVYPNKAAAKEALRLLPTNLSARKPWLKDISAVINEINTFKG